MVKFSLFKNSFANKPSDTYTLDQFINAIRDGLWKKPVMSLRMKENPNSFKAAKKNLPALTISGNFKSRDVKKTVAQRLNKASGLICIDVDQKDNPKMRVGDLTDKDCVAQFASCSGRGKKIIYYCKPTKDPAEHRRIFDAVVQRLEKLGVKINVDPIVKSVASLQYVSYDPDVYYKPSTKLVIQPLPPIVLKPSKTTKDQESELKKLHEFINALGPIDITKDYESWMQTLFGLSYTFGDTGRVAAHKLSKNYKGYSKQEVDEKYDACLERGHKAIEKPITISSVYQLINEHIPKVKLRHLAKKYNTDHVVGTGKEDDPSKGDLAGFVQYKLFLFKKIIDKEANTVIDLIPMEINLNEFEALLKRLGFYKFEKRYVCIHENIVEEVDQHEIMRIVTGYIEKDGSYQFTYKETIYQFSWEELVHRWRKIRATSGMYLQIAAGVTTWVPNLLKDTATHSFIPFRNGILEITAESKRLVQYSQIKMQIWRERILPRDFKFDRTPGMFEEFFINVMGRGDNRKQRRASKHYKNALWAYGYMLQGTKRESVARAWLLYDVKHGNNGRSGKTIIGNAVSKIRNVLTLDGKRVDLKYQFAFDAIEPWTDVVFIDDPNKGTSLAPMFNMISGTMNAEKKGGRTLVTSVKIMVASNWIMEAGGSSEVGRQFATQLDDYYVRYSKEHGDTIQPIVDLHGKEFFNDWNAKDWAQFDNFSVLALQYHLGQESPENIVDGNLQLVRFLQMYEDDLFYELARILRTCLIKMKSGWAIPQTLLIAIVEEAIPNSTRITAGRIVREFMTAIGIRTPSVTTYTQGSSNKTVWKFNCELSEITFGNREKELPKWVL